MRNLVKSIVAVIRVTLWFSIKLYNVHNTNGPFLGVRDYWIRSWRVCNCHKIDKTYVVFLLYLDMTFISYAKLAVIDTFYFLEQPLSILILVSFSYLIGVVLYCNLREVFAFQNRLLSDSHRAVSMVWSMIIKLSPLYSYSVAELPYDQGGPRHPLII